LELDEIQGDVLIGLQKFVEQFVFFQIADVPAFKRILRHELAKRITTTREVHLREFQLRDHKTQGGKGMLPLVGVNVGFTQNGIKKLVPGADLGDASFKSGAKALAPSLHDPSQAGQLSTWLAPYLADNFDGVFLVAGGTAAAVAAEVKKVSDLLGTSIKVLVVENGETRPDSARGHEHFGWLDGVSQPGINGLTIPNPGQEMLDPGLFVFGYPPNPVNAPLPPWIKNGSFMAFRRLGQLVPEFQQFLLDQAKTLGMDPVLLGARVVGRWQSGAPVALTPTQDDLTIGTDPKHNNDFDFVPVQKLIPIYSR
jgi:deferrochelatase/peroxidase EfeB